jgi:hypothetical protein
MNKQLANQISLIKILSWYYIALLISLVPLGLVLVEKLSIFRVAYSSYDWLDILIASACSLLLCGCAFLFSKRRWSPEAARKIIFVLLPVFLSMALVMPLIWFHLFDEYSKVVFTPQADHIGIEFTTLAIQWTMLEQSISAVQINILALTLLILVGFAFSSTNTPQNLLSWLIIPAGVVVFTASEIVFREKLVPLGVFRYSLYLIWMLLVVVVITSNTSSTDRRAAHRFRIALLVGVVALICANALMANWGILDFFKSADQVAEAKRNLVLQGYYPKIYSGMIVQWSSLGLMIGVLVLVRRHQLSVGIAQAARGLIVLLVAMAAFLTSISPSLLISTGMNKRFIAEDSNLRLLRVTSSSASTPDPEAERVAITRHRVFLEGYHILQLEEGVAGFYDLERHDEDTWLVEPLFKYAELVKELGDQTTEDGLSTSFPKLEFVVDRDTKPELIDQLAITMNQVGFNPPMFVVVCKDRQEQCVIPREEFMKLLSSGKPR